MSCSMQSETILETDLAVHPTDFVNRPLFITGYNKSGTTLILSLLDNHPQLLVIPEELHFCKGVLLAGDKMDALRKKTGFRLFLSDDYLDDWSQGKSWLKEGYPEFDKAAFDRKISAISIEGDAFDILRGAIRAFAEVDGCDPSTLTGWVSKTTQDELYFPVLQNVFGSGARFVYVVRDPRDVFFSYSKRARISDSEGVDTRSLLLSFIAEWRAQVRHAFELCEQYENTIILRYEDIISDLRPQMERVSEFLGLEWSDALLEPSRHGKQWEGNSVFTEKFSGVSSSAVGRFRGGLDSGIVKLLEAGLSEEMRRLGYELDYDGRGSVGHVEYARTKTRQFIYSMKYRAKLAYINYRD